MERGEYEGRGGGEESVEGGEVERGEGVKVERVWRWREECGGRGGMK